MTKVIIARQAQLDIYGAWAYIAQNKETAADRWIDSIRDKCNTLAQHPRLGPGRPDLGKELRYFPAGSYLILYREIPQGIEIVRLLHGARNLEAIFHGEE